MTSVLLIYPYFKPTLDRSVFRFPPLGVSYIAASLQEEGHEVHLLDCSFLHRDDALRQALATRAEVVGIYCMVTMLEDSLWLARHLRDHCDLMVAGGPLPTCDPVPFLEHFDVVVCGEGEQTMNEILRAYAEGSDLGSVPGIAYRKADNLTPGPGPLQTGHLRSPTGRGECVSPFPCREGGQGVRSEPPFSGNLPLKEAEEGVFFTPARVLAEDLDRIPFPARELLPNELYIRYGKKKHGYSITTVMSTRGCPYRCEFCSNVVFGGSYRERSPQNVVDEVEEALGLGYDRISFADDVFTLNRGRVKGICEEIKRRGLRFAWECLGRVDAMDYPIALEMKQAGCTRVFFGIESGNDQILKLMNKKITTEQARNAVEAAHQAGLQVGAFFILGYPGDTDETVLDTLRFATSLPLGYLGLTMPYPLPGTALYERVKGQITREWRPDDSPLVNHVLIFDTDFSEAKLWFGILKGRAQFEMRQRLGKLAPLVLKLFEKPTDALFRRLR